MEILFPKPKVQPVQQPMTAQPGESEMEQQLARRQRAALSYTLTSPMGVQDKHVLS